MPIAAGNPGPLLGRNVEIDLLASLLGGIDTGGSALVLSGEPGIGKSRLLSAAAERARERGLVVLSTTGVQSEAHLPFAGPSSAASPVAFPGGEPACRAARRARRRHYAVADNSRHLDDYGPRVSGFAQRRHPQAG